MSLDLSLCMFSTFVLISCSTSYPIEPWAFYVSFDVARRDKTIYRLTQSVESPEQDFGALDLGTISWLDSVHQVDRVSFRVVISSSDLSKVPRSKKTRKRIKLSITINIFGHGNMAEEVGENHSRSGVYLQHPVFLEAGIKYANPHYLYPDDTRTDLRPLIGPVLADTRLNRVSHVVGKIIDSLGTVQLPQSRNDANRFQYTSRTFLVDTELRR